MMTVPIHWHDARADKFVCDCGRALEFDGSANSIRCLSCRRIHVRHSAIPHLDLDYVPGAELHAWERIGDDLRRTYIADYVRCEWCASTWVQHGDVLCIHCRKAFRLEPIYDIERALITSMGAGQ